MLWTAYQTSLLYAFNFEDGYPIYPVIVLGVCFSAFVRLRPPGAPRPVVYTSRDVDPFMIFVLAVMSCAFLLDHRGEKPFTLTWFVHMSVLTYFAMLIPFITGYASGKGKKVVATLTALALATMFWKGTTQSHHRQLETNQEIPTLRQTGNPSHPGAGL
jgi:hypothetical protein